MVPALSSMMKREIAVSDHTGALHSASGLDILSLLRHTAEQGRQNEIFPIPDILCNSGSVIVSYFEWVQDLQQLFWEEEEVARREYQILDRAFDQMVARAKREKVFNRTAAMAIGLERVRAAKTTRGLFP
jgi:glutamate dehydrogenase/leucine dehydrogenase